MTDKKKNSIIRCWNKCDKTSKLRIAAEFFISLRSDEPTKDWWLFLNKKFSTFTKKTEL
jgi:hypothetical protein